MGVTEHADAGTAALIADGYRFVIPIVPEPGDFDAQDHLNNASTVRLFNDLRVAYVRGEVGDEWVETIRRDRLVVAAREVHVLYESEGLPGDAFVGGLRYIRREGRRPSSNSAWSRRRRAGVWPGRGSSSCSYKTGRSSTGPTPISPGWPRSKAGRSRGVPGRPPEAWGPPR